MNVLLIEDDLTDLKLLHSVLAADGHEVTDARSAEQAVRFLSRLHPHVILTDLSLPEMDGVELVKRLKASVETKDIPVVAVTAYQDRFPKGAARRDAGFAAFITKPIDPETLSEQVATAARHN